MAHLRYKYCPQCTSLMLQGLDGYNHCTGGDCSFVQYGNPTPVVAAIVEYDEATIVLAHNKLWPAGWYGLITGFLERHEHPEEAIVREVKEELGLDAQLQSFVGHYTFERMNQIIMAYHLTARGSIVLNDELDDFKLVSMNKAAYWPSGTGYALRDFLVGRGFTPMERGFK